ncbi:hypothetical protein KM043_018008 [Ampulex compressa]|nr:hypothetical protein KM043_018008 [Ampulex compressa]
MIVRSPAERPRATEDRRRIGGGCLAVARVSHNSGPRRGRGSGESSLSDVSIMTRLCTEAYALVGARRVGGGEGGERSSDASRCTPRGPSRPGSRVEKPYGEIGNLRFNRSLPIPPLGIDRRAVHRRSRYAHRRIEA